ncbi:uncharacterized protein T551_02387 [Pneumocystis jirovecii RU7]|uniref:UBX domain-containing protein n=1 Tax=Pneumocystis jirovecii (strain RU7) TaxID=1408657 RepID=A0A0W4ZL59_PNEJ7|nr:uncharacterized protein T551_02387 [Pneumocystis jirovecii RU7]KTW29113.1 hypothetical protein T551_02387 [Pneumocystis jirovecii RU7]
MKDDIWSKESIEDSISRCLKTGLVFLVYIQDGEDTKWIDQLLSPEVCKEMRKKTISLKLHNGTSDAILFKQMVVVNCVPSIFLIKDGLVKKYLCSDATTEDLLESIRSMSTGKHISEQVEGESVDMGANSTSEGVGSSSTHEKMAQRLTHMKTKDMEQRQKYVEGIERTKKCDAEERKRVLSRINADKEERKIKEYYRISARSSQSSTFVEDTAVQGNAKNICFLNIRLLNGSSIQARHFTFKNTLKDVRSWIDENRTDNKIPYDLIQIYPKRRFDILEEAASLEALNLCPSATLILMPLKNVTSAYVKASNGYFSRLFEFFSYFIGSIYSVFSWTLIFVGRNNSVENVEQNKKIVSSDNQKISTFQNKNKDKNMWYNGNTLNQEPPKEKNS